MSNEKASLDQRMRQAAFDHVWMLSATRDALTSKDLGSGFVFEGNRFPLVNPQRGIFKPREMQHLLSIRTVFPRPGAKVWYDDQRNVHEKIYGSEDFVEYAFMGNNPDAADNQWLRDAWQQRIPILYFIGVAPGQFMANRAYIGGWDATRLKALVGFGDALRAEAERLPDSEPARRYALRAAKQRLHQATFRQAVITAYEGRCALSGLPEPMLLDAAHIIADNDEDMGQPVVPNGLPMSKLHHAAFDAHLLGIDPDFRLHVSDRLLGQHDGPMLEALKQLDKRMIRLPRRTTDQPSRDRLAARFDVFLASR